MESIGIFNISGNIFTGQVGGLGLEKTAGTVFKIGSNYENNPYDPNVRELDFLMISLTFIYRFSNDTNDGIETTAIIPNEYEDLVGFPAGGVVDTVPNNDWLIQRIYSFTSNNVSVQKGQTVYNTLNAALLAINTENHITDPSTAEVGLLRCWMVIRGGATDLNDSGDAVFVIAPKFGESGGGASSGGGTVSTMQVTYDNSITPQIITSLSGGAFALQQGGGVGVEDNVLTVADTGTVQRFSVTGDGSVTGTTFNNVALTTGGTASHFLNEVGDYTPIPVSASLAESTGVITGGVLTTGVTGQFSISDGTGQIVDTLGVVKE